MANTQDVQNAIAAHDNTKRLTVMPKFYGNTKDTLTARKFIKRFEQAAAIGTWNDKRKCAEFCHLLHSEANGFMTMTLKKAKVTEDDWAGHKKVFLKFYDVKGTAKLNFFSLHEMKQDPKKRSETSGPKFNCTWTALRIWSTFMSRHKGHGKTRATVKLAALTCTTVPVQMNTECGLVPSSCTACIANIGLIDNPYVTGGLTLHLRYQDKDSFRG